MLLAEEPSALGPILRVGSAAMSSARMSNTCCSGYGWLAFALYWTGRLIYLGHSLIIDTNKITRRGIDLKGLVEGQSRLEEGVR